MRTAIIIMSLLENEKFQMGLKITLICNPENRRAVFFREACERLGLDAPEEIAWEDILKSDELPVFETDAIRIESPGENFEVERQLIKRGGGPFGLTEDRGLIRWQRAWFSGWESVLSRIAKENQGARFMNTPFEIARMFHKSVSQKLMAQQGVPIPEPLGGVTSYAQLRQEMNEKSVRRVFVKPDHSSSASGVIALQTASNGRISAIAPVELVDDAKTGMVQAYNTLRIRNYTEESDVERLIDALVPQNIFVERWFPKASLNGRVFDIRVIVIGGEARHAVVRTSRGPITNLHLGNKRGDINEVRNRLGGEKWEEALNVCEKAAEVFPGSLMVAVDLMIGSGFQQFAVAEVNAFGDLLPNVLSRGDDTYTAELRGFVKRL